MNPHRLASKVFSPIERTVPQYLMSVHDDFSGLAFETHVKLSLDPDETWHSVSPESVPPELWRHRNSLFRAALKVQMEQDQLV